MLSRSHNFIRAWPLVSLTAFSFVLVPSCALAAGPLSLFSSQDKTTQAPAAARVPIKTPFDAPVSNPIIVQASISGEESEAQFIETLYFQDQLFILFEDIIRLFNFPIKLNHSASRADGFFISPERTFSLDVDNLLLQVGTLREKITQDDFRQRKNQLYLSQDALRTWFGLESNLDRAHSHLYFSPNFLSFLQTRALRNKKRLKILTAYKKTETKEATSNQPTPSPSKENAAAKEGTLAKEKTLARSPQLYDTSGTTTAGYEVELYRNNKLIAFQTADEKGYYAFQRIPLLLGKNVFRLAFLGPHGQHEEKSETRIVQLPLRPPPQEPQKTVKPPALIVETQKKKEKKKEKKREHKKTRTAMAVSTELQSVPIQAQNWTSLSVIQSGEKKGLLEAYMSGRGTFLRLDEFLRYMNIAYRQQKNSDEFQITDSKNRQITLDLAQNIYMRLGKQHKLYNNDAFKNEGKIYANTDLLYRLFQGSTFLVDPALEKIELPDPQKEEVPASTIAQEETEQKDLAPAPLAAPVQPVIIDSSSMPPTPLDAPPNEEKNEGQDVLHLSQQARSEEEEEPESTSEDGESLILQPQLKNISLSSTFIEALDFPDQVFLPLDELLQIIGFPIKFNKNQTEASGFFFTQSNKFYLNIAEKEVIAGGKKMTLTQSDILIRDGQVYISKENFEEWFGITCDINRQRSIIHLKTDKLFPEEEKQKRQKKWNKLLSAVELSDEDLPLIKNSYKAFGYPMLDVNLGSTYTHNETSQENTHVSNYNIQGAMELGYLTSEIYLQGSTNSKIINTFRFQVGRKDPMANLLGELHATNFEIGDISSPSVSFVTANSLGRGVMLTNRGTTTSENFDTRNFTGDSVPGYEAELYRNNILIDFQTVDAEGRYSFTEIPILYGKNIFRVVLYGPQGQIEERTETISTSSALLKKNKFEYTFGALQRGLNLLNERKRTSSQVPNGTQLVGSFRYGLSQNQTIGASFAETQLEDGPHHYVTASSGANLFGVLSQASFAKDITSGGWASGLSLLGGFKGISLRTRYRHYSDFVSEVINNSSVPLKSEGLINANTQVVLPYVNNFSVGLSAKREEFVNKNLAPRFTYGAQIAKNLWGLSFTNKVDYILDDNKRFQNTFGFQTRLWDINLRATGIYNFAPIQEFRKASFMADYKITDKLSAQTQIEKDIVTDETSLGQNINWDFDAFRLSLNNQIDNDGNFTVGMNVLFSINHNEVSNKWLVQPQQTTKGGAIAGRVFVDENGNGLYDKGEKLVSDTSIRVNRAAVELDENGYFVSPVTPYETSKVTLSVGELSDPLLTPKTNGYRFQTRPGDTVVADFPLIHTTLIDGTSYFLEEDGSKRELGNIVIELQDKNGKPLRRTISEVDGYYTFDKIEKGEYWINVPDEVLTSYNAALEKRKHIVIEEINEFITDMDVVLKQKEDLTAPPDFCMPEPSLPPSLPAMPALPMSPTPPPIPSPIKESRNKKEEPTPLHLLKTTLEEVPHEQE